MKAATALSSARRVSPGATLLVATLALVTFLPAIGHDFINLDDGDYVSNNPHVRGGLTPRAAAWAFRTFHAANWHPVTWLSHMLDASLFGLEPWGHHLTSVLIHAAVSGLLFALLAALTGAPGRSLLAAALFAVHPLRVESVAWVAERKDVLAALFLVLILLAYLGYVRRPRPGRYAGAVALFALGLMAKPMLVTLPVLLLLLDLWPLGRLRAAARGRGTAARPALPSPGRLLGEKLPFFALALASGLATLAAQSSRGAVATIGYFPAGMRLGNALNSLLAYLGKTLWPRDLVVFYIHPGALPGWRVSLLLAAAVAITLACVAARRRHPWLLVGWLWYVVTLLPVLGIVQVGEQGMADRYTYLPHVGLLLAAVWTGAALAGRRARAGRPAALPAAAAVAVLALLSLRQLDPWKDSLALMRHTIRLHPNTWWAYNNLGIVLSQEGRHEEALAKLDMALRIRPGFSLALYNKGLILKARGDLPEAARMFAEAVRVDPGHVEARVDLGEALAETGRPEAALEHYAHALRLEPDNLAARAGLGNALSRLGRAQEALAEYDKALELDEILPEVYYNRGTILAQQGDFAGAAAAFRRAVEVDARYAEAWNNLGAALMMQGRLDEARAALREAVRLRPGYRSAEVNLERLEARRSGAGFPR